MEDPGEAEAHDSAAEEDGMDRNVLPHPVDILRRQHVQCQ